MVINNFNMIWPIILPIKADSILFIDFDTELSFPITFQCLKVISWGSTEFVKSFN